MLNKESRKYEFKYFFEKINKIKAAAAISRLSRLVNDNTSQDLT